MHRPSSFYLALTIITVVLAATATVLTIALQSTTIITELLHALHIPGVCYPTPKTYTLLTTGIPLSSVVADIEGASLYIEGVEHGNTTVIVEDRGGCNGRVSAKIENGALKLRVDTHGCCSIRVELPLRRYNMSLDLSAASLKLENLAIDRLTLTASASAIKILNSAIGIAKLSFSASAAKLYNTNVSIKLSVSASASAIKLMLLNRGASIVLQRTTASSVSGLCPEAPAPTIAVSASASSIEILCKGTR